MTQLENAKIFHALHIKGNPLIIYNIWDAGTAKALQEAGAKAIATGSWAVAAAHGYSDGEKVPFEQVLVNLREIGTATNLPLSLDMEGGYRQKAEDLHETISQVIAVGAIGINFEDQIVGGTGLYSPQEQGKRIAAVRQAAEVANIPFFINARTDVFLKSPAAEHDEAKLQEAIERAKIYADSGASGFFAPGLQDSAMIRRLCEAVSLPVNIMMRAGVPSSKELASLGVARISYGGMPYYQLMNAFKEAAAKALALE